MAKNKPVAAWIEAATAMSPKTLREIGAEIGYSKPNFISMLRKGIVKIPVQKVPLLAKACGVDPVHGLNLALSEYMPEVAETIREYLGEPLSGEEAALLEAYREAKAELDDVAWEGIGEPGAGQVLDKMREKLSA